MVNATYKHLDAKLRLGGLRVGQWLQLVFAAGCAALFGIYLSPLAPGPTIALSVFVAGLPVAVSFAAMGLEFSAGGFLAAVWRWGRAPRRYLPGAGTSALGYLVAPDEHAPEFDRARDTAPISTLAELWD